jgi:ABC-type Fe3+/spermidine/putrescine transport system ATPase subunit
MIDVLPHHGSPVALSALSKSFGGRSVLENLSLQVAAGEFLAVLGPSGSGKTTMMRIIAGFEAPDSGTVSIDGVDVTAVPAEKRRVNTVFQSYALFPHLNVLDNVAFGPRMRGVGIAERDRAAKQLLELVQLPDVADRMPRELSGGMQQRVALARALANQPSVLLLDEPLGALDRKLREEMQRELRGIQRELGTTFIYVTHDQDEAFGLADRLAVMRSGRFVQIGLPGDVYDRPANAWVAAFLGGANAMSVQLGSAGSVLSALGPLRASYVDPRLRAGDTAVAMVRPEATRIGTADIYAANQFAGHLIDLVVAGPSLRLKAVADDGVNFEALARRDAAVPALNPGDPVTISFDPAFVRVYPVERTPPLERSSDA